MSSCYITRRKHAATPIRPAAALALAALALPALGQDAAPAPSVRTLGEVRVQDSVEAPEYRAERASSPKFTQPLVDTPQSVTVIRREVLQDQAAITLTDALRNTPGITFQLGENGNTATGDAVFMRGYDTQGSIFVDGVRDVGTISRDVFNIEQVEIVKGPAGADIGRGAPTGYINLLSKVPTAENFFTGSVSAGSADQKRATIDLNRALNAEGTAALRLNAMAQDSGVPGRDFVRNKGVGLAPSLALGLNTPTRIYLSWLHMEQRNRPDGGLPTTGLPGYSVPQLAARGGNAGRVDTGNFYGYLSDRDDVTADMLTARVEHTLAPDVTLRNITRWGRTEQDLVVTGPFSNTLITPSLANPASWLVRLLPQGKLQTNKILTNQTNVTADLELGGLRHALTGGIELTREEQDTGTRAATINAGNGVRASDGTFQAYTGLYSPNPGRAFVPVTGTGARTEGRITSAAAYLFDTVKLGAQWQLLAGLRAEHYRSTFAAIAAPAGGAQVVTTGDRSGELYTGKLGIVYKPAANGSIYAAVANSALPPGSGFTFSTTAANINNLNRDPQKATTAEIGTKWDVLDRRLALAAAVYHTQNRNETVSTDSVTNTVVQFGKTRVQGVELSAVGQITPAWQLISGIGYNDASVQQGTAAQNGAAVRYSPKLTATLWTTYRLPAGLTVGGGVRHVDTQARSTTNTSPAFFPEIPSYTVFDAMVGYRLDKNVALQLNLFNLTDKFYLARTNNAGNRYLLGATRSALLSAHFTF